MLSSPTDKLVIKEWHFYFQQLWIIFLCILCGLLSSISNRFSPCIIPLCFYSPFQHEGFFVCLFFWQHLNFLCLYSINSDVLFNCSIFKTSRIYYLYHLTNAFKMSFYFLRINTGLCKLNWVRRSWKRSSSGSEEINNHWTNACTF